MPDPVLSTAERAFLSETRRAMLATIAADGRPRLVPICFVLDPARPVIWTPLDEKPKRIDEPLRLARVRDVLADPRVSVLVDRWDEDWGGLAWLRCRGTASIVDASGQPSGVPTGEHGIAVTSLRAKYPQYATHRLEVYPMVRIDIEQATSWGALAGADGSADRGGLGLGRPAPSMAEPGDEGHRQE